MLLFKCFVWYYVPKYQIKEKTFSHFLQKQMKKVKLLIKP